MCLVEPNLPQLQSTKLKIERDMHRSDFLKQLKQLFPSLRNEINQEYGLLHCEMAVFHNHVQDLIKRDRRDEVGKAFTFAHHCYTHGNNALKKAIDVSFVEGLELKDFKWAWNLLPTQLQELHLKFHGNIYG